MTTDNTRIPCQKCENTNAPDAEFCGICGNPLLPTGTSQTTQQTPVTPRPEPTQPIGTSPYFPTQYAPPPPPPPVTNASGASKKARRTPWMLIVLFAIVFLGSSLFYAGYQVSRITPSPNATSTTNGGGSSPNATSTTEGTQTPPSGTTPTATAQATVGPSTTSKEKRLSCSKCSNGEPILLTINKITVSSTGMTWYSTLTNQSGNDFSFRVTPFYLQDLSGVQHVDGTGDFLSSHSGYSIIDVLGARQTANGEIIFPFVPYVGVRYNLTAEIDGSYNDSGKKFSFDPITLTCTNSGCQLS